jgi:hypothetical protein
MGNATTFFSTTNLKSELLAKLQRREDFILTVHEMETQYGIPAWLAEYILYFRRMLPTNRDNTLQTIFTNLPSGVHLDAIYHIFTSHMLLHAMDAVQGEAPKAALERLVSRHRTDSRRLQSMAPYPEDATEDYATLAEQLRIAAQSCASVEATALHAAAMCIPGQSPVWSFQLARQDDALTRQLLESLCCLLQVSGSIQPARYTRAA